MNSNNIDVREIAKFNEAADRWWDLDGEFKTLHDINPLRLNYIKRVCNGIHQKQILDVGCGGGILAESMARHGADVSAIDMADDAVNVARQHAVTRNLDINYATSSAEDWAEQHAESYDIITCLEMLEHVPDPSRIVNACARLCRPGGQLIFSTLNRHPKAFMLAIVGAEYLLRLLPRGMHHYEQFIKPSELSQWARHSALDVKDLTGLSYNPLTGHHTLCDNIDVNYLMQCNKPNN